MLDIESIQVNGHGYRKFLYLQCKMPDSEK